MADKWIFSTDEQEQQALLVQHDVLETINRLGREGIDPRLIMAGLAAATSDLLTSTFGNTAVAPWFDGQAAVARELLRGGN